MANTYGRQVVVPLTNKSGGGVIAGDVVVVDTTNNDAFTTTASANFTGTVGIAQATIAANAVGPVLLSGYAALVNVNASVTRGHYGATYTVAKQATDAGASRGAGTFCEFLTGGTTPDAVVWPVDLLGSSLANPMTTTNDMILGGSSGAPTRLASVASKFLQTDGSGNVSWGAAPSSEMDYAQITASVSPTATTEATANTVVTGNSVTYDGSTTVMVQFFSHAVRPTNSAGAQISFWLYDGASSIGYMGYYVVAAAQYANIPMNLTRRLTPSAGAHTYSVRASVSGGTGSVEAGAGGAGTPPPAFIRITKV